MAQPVTPTIALRTPTGDIDVPLLGLGTWRADGEQARRAVRHALDVGYRHVDTATGYANEDQVGRGIADSGTDRADVFVTTKLPPEAAGRERETLERSLTMLGTDYVDLWLVHWPPGGRAHPSTWRAFQELRDEGLVRAIGVSNYSIGQIDELIEATGEAPAINQIPWSPRDHDSLLASEHARRAVALEGYSPFRRTDAADLVLTRIAEEHGATVHQVVVMWHLRHRVVVIPKSTNPERIESNLAALDVTLSAEEVAAIDGLSRR